MTQGEERDEAQLQGSTFAAGHYSHGCALPLSYRHVEERLEARGVPVEHATIQRWVGQYSPLLEDALHRRKRPVWIS